MQPQFTVLTGTDRLNRQITVDGLAVTDCRQGLHGSFYKPFVTHHIRSGITSIHCSAIWNLVFPFSMALFVKSAVNLEECKKDALCSVPFGHASIYHLTKSGMKPAQRSTQGQG